MNEPINGQIVAALEQWQAVVLMAAATVVWYTARWLRRYQRHGL